MLTIEAKKREVANKTKSKSSLSAVLYGPEIENQSIEINAKDFKKVFKEAGESSLVTINLEGKEYLVLIYETQTDPITNELRHIDFYQPILTEEVEAYVNIIFEGESLAVKDLGGTLIKEIQEIEVKALPQNLPHELRVDIGKLKTFEDEILVKDLNLPENVTVAKKPEDVVAMVTAPEDIEEELEKPIEEKVDEVEGVNKEEKPEEETEGIAQK